MPKNVFILIFSLFFLPLFAQQEPENAPIYVIPDEYAKIHQKGEQALLQKKYDEALRYFKRVLKKFPDFSPALRSVGACYELQGNFEEASGYYLKAIESNPHFSRALYYECGKTFYQSGNYRKALKIFEQFDTLRHLEPLTFNYNGIEELAIEKEYYAVLPASIRACNVALDSIQFWNIPSVFNLGKAVNSNADEYFPFLSNDGSTIFYTSRKNENADENLFMSTRPRGEWRIGEQVSDFNTAENEGMASMVRDGRRMYFTACQRPQVLGPCDIWEARVNGYQVEPGNPVIGYANSGDWESQASISCDGSMLFFASNREGGQGGADIWMSRHMADNRWSEPENLGPNINTAGDEEAPFISNDGKVIYFSSTGHLGLGEQDIFMSRIQADSTWGYPVNLGMPVNSAYRELGFYLTADGKTGYFASNRTGGLGGMDIYRFDLPEQLASDPITYVEGYVRDSITRLPVRTNVFFKNHPPVQTDEEGRFFMCLKANDTLRMEIRADDYHAYRNEFSIPFWENKVFYSLNILLDPLFRLPIYTGELAGKGVDIPPMGGTTELRHSVLFSFDEDELKVEEVTKLSEFLRTAITGNPVVAVDIIGYADDIGTDAYNLLLSEKRAKNVGVFLKDKGIRVDKIYIEGKGEAESNRPKWQNRRVEVVVLLAK